MPGPGLFHWLYLDKRRIVLALTASFVLLNVGLTRVSILLGSAYYGYGFALALLAGFVLLGRTMERLEYQTFMMQ